jgi:hypothetical protein
VKTQEIQFWRTQATKGRLINAIRSERDRAIHFFGAYDVAREDEYGLLYVLDAYEILNRPNHELLKEVKMWPRLSDSDIAKLSPQTRKKVVETQKSAMEQVSQLKARALQILESRRTRKL